jgi:hypothetical protein
LADGGIKGLGFDGNATTESLHGSAEVLHGYLEGSDIYFHAHWMPTTANIGEVQWNLEYSWINANGTFANPTIITVLQEAGGTAWAHKTAPFPAIDGTGMEHGSAITYRLYRDPTLLNDDYPSDAGLIQIGIHYQVDVYGSRQQFVK